MWTILVEMPISTESAEKAAADPHAGADLEVDLWKRAAVQLRSFVPADRWWAIRKTVSVVPSGVAGFYTATLRIDIEPGVALKAEPGAAEKAAGIAAEVLPGPVGLAVRAGAAVVGKLWKRKKGNGIPRKTL